MLIPAGYCLAKYRFRQTGDAEEQIFTVGHEALTFTGTALADALFDAFRDTVTPGYWSSSYTFQGVDVQAGSTTGGEGPFYTHSSTLTPVVGTEGGAILPSNCAVLVRKITDAPGRRGRGRLYLPGFIAESVVDGLGTITSANVTSLQTAFTAWLARLNSDALTPFVLHESPPATPSEIVGFQVQNRIATQRRRMRR